MTKTQSKPAILSAKKSDIEMVMVTPDLALAWLENTKFNNRKVSEIVVKKIETDIRNNRWKFDGSPLRFDQEGNLVDGQHRLWAVQRAQRSVLCLVVRNLEEHALNIIDTGKSRSFGDILHFNGYVNSNSLSSAARLSIMWRKFNGDLRGYAAASGKIMCSSTEVVEEVENNKSLVDSLQFLVSYKFTKKFMGLGAAALCHFIFAKIDKLQADEFFYLMEKGTDLADGHAALALRNSLTLRDHLVSRTAKGSRHRSAYLIAIIIKAWNAYREERFIKRLTYGEDREAYPRPI